MNGTTQFNNISLTSSGTGNSAFIAKFDPGGSAIWVREIPSTVSAVAMGLFSGTATFGFTSNISSTGPQDLFVLKLNSSGTLQWFQTEHIASGGSILFGEHIAVDNLGRVLVGGTFTKTQLFKSMCY